MPEGYDIKKLLTRMIRRVGVQTENRVMATRVLVDEGRAVGVTGLNIRTGEFVVVKAKAVILCCGAAGRHGPACAYVSGPFGGYTVNAKGNRFMLSDYWSGQMMMEFYKELTGPNGPVYLKMNHLAPETVAEIGRILHTTERPSRGRFHAGRGTDYGEQLVEMAVSEIGLCSGHSASGV
jgi:succinate dehydrogenase/fumarate reductase flavoprotein subunit